MALQAAKNICYHPKVGNPRDNVEIGKWIEDFVRKSS
jgi:hypothetical protein